MEDKGRGREEERKRQTEVGREEERAVDKWECAGEKRPDIKYGGKIVGERRKRL